MEQLLCPWGPASYIFYSNDGVPQLLYYAYIPIIVIALFFSIFIFLKDNRSLRSSLLLLISLAFVGSTLNTIFEWVSNNPYQQMYSWQLTAFFELPISLLSVYFAYVFLENKDSIKLKYLLLWLFLPIIILLPTKLNISQFYLTEEDCGGVLGILWYYIYSLEVLSIFIVAYIGFRKYFQEIKNKLPSIQTLIFTIGSILFIGMFNVSNIFGELTKTYEINLIGPIGLLLFISLLSYSIVKFKTFNIKLLAAQALVWALIILVGSQFTFVQNSVNRLLTAITLVIGAILGLMIIRSVKKEDILREQLEMANAGQTNLIHIMNHQIKGYLSVNKNIFAELMTDDYGKVPEAANDIIKQGFENSDKGARYVTDILKGASAENGTLPYDMEKMDFKKVVLDQIENQKKGLEKKNLKLYLNIKDENYEIVGDNLQLGEAVRNLIENSIHYTIKGSISVSLHHTGDKIIFSVKDTGVGVREEDKDKMFKTGGVSKDSLKLNVGSSGYGLAFVKGVVEKHNGKVWFESEGHNKGSIFYMELPTK